jgi:hypothetical protein
MNFQEDFLQTVWKYQYFDKNSLQTTEGLPIEVKKIGYHNFHEGPDFLEAQIKLREIGSFRACGSAPQSLRLEIPRPQCRPQVQFRRAACGLGGGQNHPQK